MLGQADINKLRERSAAHTRSALMVYAIACTMEGRANELLLEEVQFQRDQATAALGTAEALERMAATLGGE